MLLAGELDAAPISSIEYARNADRLRLLPRLCVASEGAVDSIQLVSRKPLEQVRIVAVTPGVRDVGRAHEGPAPRRRAGAARRGDADAKLLIGDAALKSAFEDPTPHYDLGRLWLERTGLPMVFAVWACPEPVADGLAELEDALVASVRQARAEPEQLAHEAAERYGYPAGFLARYFEKLRYRFGPRERAGLYTFLELARDAGELETVPELRFVQTTGPPSHERHGERRSPRSSRRRSTASGSPTRTPSRCSSRATSSPSGASRTRSATACTIPDRVTFIIDRNLNYTNICTTDCDFCAFYRRPGDAREGYLLPKPIIFKKIEETLAIGGTGLLMQGGHHPDLGIDYYEDLFRSIKAQLPDPPARAVAARDPAHLAPVEADDPRDADAAARRGARLDPRRRRRDPRRPRARHHRAEEDEVAPSGST